MQLKARLFNTSSYQVGVNSMKYTPTQLMMNVIEKVYLYFQEVNFKVNEVKLEPLDFIVTAKQLSEISISETIMLLNHSIGYTDEGFVIRPKLQDNQESRVYSVFTSISGNTRKLLGFINYDINTALQTISLQLVENPNQYPLHQEYVKDKKSFRNIIAEETGFSLDKVKKELTKADNLDKVPNRYDKYPILRAYWEESLKLRDDVIKSIPKNILGTALKYATPKYEKFWNKKLKKYEFFEIGKKESSVFFFIWTQYERKIREAMMSCFKQSQACHQVHDAVYSKEKIDPTILEKAVFEQTGFKVKISH